MMKRSRDSGKLTRSDVLAYIKSVKDALDENKHLHFLGLLRDYHASEKTEIYLAGVTARVKELLKGHPDLILGFNVFLPKDFMIQPDEDELEPPSPSLKKHKKLQDHQDTVDAIDFVNKIKRLDPNVYILFLEILNDLRSNPTENSHVTEAFGRVADLFLPDNLDLFNEFTTFLPDPSPVTTHHYAVRSKPPPKKRSDSVRVDRRCTPSYILLPEPLTQSTDDIGAQVLNNTCRLSVSYTADGRCRDEDGSWEDNMFEFDMLLRTVKGTKVHTKKLLSKINNTIELDSSFRIEDHFTAPHLRYINFLYAKNGTDVIHILRKDPAKVLPIIYRRLKTKLAEVRRVHSEFTARLKMKLESGCLRTN